MKAENDCDDDLKKVSVDRDSLKSDEIAHNSDKSGFEMSGLVPEIDPTTDPIFSWG